MKEGKFKDSKLLNWVKTKGKNSLGNVLDIVGEFTGKEMIEKIGESLQDDPTIPIEDKKEIAALVRLELDADKIEQEELTKRWESDNTQDLKLPRLVRPVVLLYSWVVVTLIIVLEACHIVLPSSSIIIGMCGTVNVAYFGSRGYEKIIKFKNRNK